MLHNRLYNGRRVIGRKLECTPKATSCVQIRLSRRFASSIAKVAIALASHPKRASSCSTYFVNLWPKPCAILNAGCRQCINDRSFNNIDSTCPQSAILLHFKLPFLARLPFDEFMDPKMWISVHSSTEPAIYRYRSSSRCNTFSSARLSALLSVGTTRLIALPARPLRSSA